MENEWVKCSDKMPKQGEVILFYQTYPRETMFNCRADPLPRNFYHVGGLRYDGNFIDNNDQYSIEGIEFVSHWMPLTAPPKHD